MSIGIWGFSNKIRFDLISQRCVRSVQDRKNTHSDGLFIDAYANVQVSPNKTVIHLKLDTGADTNVIPLQIFRSLGIQDELEPSLRKIHAENTCCGHMCTPSAKIKSMSGFLTH